MFYTYLWLREDGTPYYACKGKGRRAYTPDSHCSRPPKDRARIIVQEFEFESDALAAEVFLIAFYGRKDLGTGCLRNLTDGGDGVSGYRFSEEEKQKNAERKRGNTYRRGCTLSVETRSKISESKVGQSPAWNAGKSWSEETKKRMCKPHKTFKKTPMSEEHKAAIRATLKAKITPEVVEAMRLRGKQGTAARWGKV